MGELIADFWWIFFLLFFILGDDQNKQRVKKDKSN